MAQTIQIVPKFSFPYVEVIVNDNTIMSDNVDSNASDTSIRMAFAFTSGKGIDNTWVKKSGYNSAVKTFGESNFKKYGQPYMQALEVLKHENSKVWLMRVMPANSAFANAFTSTYFKADTADDVADAHLRKFRVKLTSKSIPGIMSKKDFDSVELLDGVTINENGRDVYKDAEGYIQVPLVKARNAGRGYCGNHSSMRLSKPNTYEKEYGITMYNFEILNSENGLIKEANYVGSFVSSGKYSAETATLINDVLDETEAGIAPVVVNVDEDNLEYIYDEYIKFCKALHVDLLAEYEEKYVEFNIPEEEMNGTVVVSDKNKANFLVLKEIDNLIEQTEDANLPDLDEFDIIFGLKVGSNESLPAIFYPSPLTDYVDISAEDYNPLDYTESKDLVDFSSAKGLVLENGDDGYFETPRTVMIDGEAVQYTLDEEVEECYKKAFDGTYDKRILSTKRIDLSAFWDANYPYSVKQILADLTLARNSCRCYLDVGIVDSVSDATLNTLIEKYSIFRSPLISKDIHNYQVKEVSTNKKCRVTISFFLAPAYVDHITNYGFHIPFVKEYCRLSGHVKDSMLPIVEEYDTDIKEELYNARLNYFECVSENIMERAVQNTSQMENSDLLEENNVRILYVLKNNIEEDVRGEIYNFSDEATRQSFIEFEKAKYSNWVGTIVESFEIKFGTTEYEFERSILHAYVEVVFRGINKKAIVEIDINKRTYVSQVREDE